MPGTLDYYNRDAGRIAANYEAVDFSAVIERVGDSIEPGSRVLEIGCGSGRDAAVLLSKGFDVTALDGSREMLRQALRLHPELEGRDVCHALPDELPFADREFGAVLAMAVLMHVPQSELPTVFASIARVLAPGGTFAYSVNTERPGLDEHRKDPRGRHFTCLTAGGWEDLHLNAGFRTEYSQEDDDITRRTGVRWVTFICRLQIEEHDSP